MKKKLLYVGGATAANSSRINALLQMFLKNKKGAPKKIKAHPLNSLLNSFTSFTVKKSNICLSVKPSFPPERTYETNTVFASLRFFNTCKHILMVCFALNYILMNFFVNKTYLLPVNFFDVS